MDYESLVAGQIIAHAYADEIEKLSAVLGKPAGRVGSYLAKSRLLRGAAPIVRPALREKPKKVSIYGQETQVLPVATSSRFDPSVAEMQNPTPSEGVKRRKPRKLRPVKATASQRSRAKARIDHAKVTDEIRQRYRGAI